MRCAAGRRGPSSIFSWFAAGCSVWNSAFRMHSLNLTDGVVSTVGGGLGSDELCPHRTAPGEIPFVVPSLGVRRGDRHSADSDAR
jgi:hypothetical protein